MKIKIIQNDFTVCKLADLSLVNFTDNFCFLGKTDCEISLVCSTEFAPQNTLCRDDNWKAFRIEGELDFSLIGILAKITDILAKNKIGVFAVSTYNTDYILTKAQNFSAAIFALQREGYIVTK